MHLFLPSGLDDLSTYLKEQGLRGQAILFSLILITTFRKSPLVDQHEKSDFLHTLLSDYGRCSRTQLHYLYTQP